MKRFVIIIPKEEGSAELHPMKEWLRRNPQYVPQGCDATSSTSHQLRNALRRTGWTVQETPTETRLIPPGATQASVSAVLGQGGDVEESEEAQEASFGLESQLRDFIAQNISAIDVQGKRLRLYVDPTGRDGIEFPTAVGLIDILAVDASGGFFVFELKRARSPDHAMGQLARYMGWVKETIGREGGVNGVIVAKEISPALRYAVSVVPNVSLFEYEVEFRLKSAHNISQDGRATG